LATAEVTLVARRRRFTREQKRQLLAEVARTSMADVARRHDIARSQLQRWKSTEEATGTPFARLLPAAPELSAPAEDSRLFIHIDPVIVELPATASPEQIAALVHALRR
jgi:transposase-like protein